eukprot:2604754-Prymnesium_polylepis.1
MADAYRWQPRKDGNHVETFRSAWRSIVGGEPGYSIQSSSLADSRRDALAVGVNGRWPMMSPVAVSGHYARPA